MSQKIVTSKQYGICTISPGCGYSLIHYSNSPQQQARLQALCQADLRIASRFTRNSLLTRHIVEPYIHGSTVTRPSVPSDDTYIFSLKDAFAPMHCVQYGFRHALSLRSAHDNFSQQIHTDMYARSFFGTKHLPSHPYKLWLVSTWDMTPWRSCKLDTSWDCTHKHLDHFNTQIRQTLSETFAFVIELRQRSRYSWRKLDSDNFTVEAVRSVNELRHSEMSDKRKTLIGAVVWNPLPTFSAEYRAWRGWRESSRYLNSEINITTLIRGALRLSIQYYWRPGGRGNGWNISMSLGQNSGSHSTGFKRIGQGRYDLW